MPLLINSTQVRGLMPNNVMVENNSVTIQDLIKTLITAESRIMTPIVHLSDNVVRE